MLLHLKVATCDYEAANVSTVNTPTCSTPLKQDGTGPFPLIWSLTCSDSADSCPPGLYCNKGHCECGDIPSSILSCNGTDSFAFNHFCTTYSEKTSITTIGPCPFLYISKERAYAQQSLRYKLPSDVHQLTGFLCDSTNRTGTLCGRCLPDHYPLAYSFNMTCIPCPHVRWNWFRYIMAAYLPLTAFCLLILFFQINTTSSHLFAVVYYCQTVTLPFPLHIINFSYISYYSGPWFVTTAKLLTSLYGMWGLDFFRPFYSDLCLGIGPLPTMALEYLVAAYPLLLMAITYCLIAMYDRKYRAIVVLWKVFGKILSIFRRNWNIRTSVIDAFATFFYLSSFKFLLASFNFLARVRMYNIYQGHYNHSMGLFFTADVEYFGKEHLPYAIIAITLLCVFVLLPALVLMLYQTRMFHKITSLFPFRWYILHTFVDSFHGCYKDGTQPGTHDCRWFASAFLVSRVCMLVLYTTLKDTSIILILYSMILVIYSGLIGAFQPFKSSVSHYNVINSVLFLFLSLFMLALCGFRVAELVNPQLVMVFAVAAFIHAAVPLIYIAGVTLFWFYTHRRFGFHILQRLKARIKGYDQINDDLPDRIENPGSYHKRNLSSFAELHV